MRCSIPESKRPSERGWLELRSADVATQDISVRGRVTEWIRLWWRDNGESVHAFVRNPNAIIGLMVIVGWCVVAVFAQHVAPFPEHAGGRTELGRRLAAPSAERLFGTDHLGRDILSMVIMGSRVSITSGLIPIAIAALAGIPLGAIAGFYGGWIETVIMRLMDVLLSLPRLVLAIAFGAVLGPSLRNAMLALIIVSIPYYTRVIHAQTLGLKEEAFVEAARGLGVSKRRIVAKHILPNAASTIIVMFTMDLGFGILTMASLGFVGVGAQPPSPEWGLGVSIGRAYMPDWWWVSFFPGLAIFSIVMAFNLVGDGLRDSLDPRKK